AIAADRAFLQALRDASSKHGIVLIFDEVMTSRLSPGGLQEAHGIRPGMTSFAKYIGGGFSFGVFVGARQLLDRYDQTMAGSLAHAGTYNNKVMSMAAGTVGLREVYTPEAARTLSAAGEALKERLNKVFAEKKVAMQATGVGSLLSIHFQR